jgi:hypothetical protein
MLIYNEHGKVKFSNILDVTCRACGVSVLTLSRV